MRLPAVASKLKHHQQQRWLHQEQQQHHSYGPISRHHLTGACPLEINNTKPRQAPTSSINTHTRRWSHRFTDPREQKKHGDFGPHATTPRHHKPKLYKPFHYSLQLKMGSYVPPRTAPTFGGTNLQRKGTALRSNLGAVSRKQPIGRVRIDKHY